MLRSMMKAKIHRATVTESNLHYVGSVTIDSTILEKVDIMPNEKVQIVNNNNGARLETYVIAGEPGSGTICLNGAAARLVQPGDQVIIIAYAWLNESEVVQHQPKIAIMNEHNQIEQLIEEEVYGLTTP
ncbi:L-aspartate 1-decarboxylase [Seinonella peptonophila]|uniref:Aspartate 1-decarboxylase n=1 Tax=Seinonella peptonophila TaxID=112248 RepID=A0A1M4SUZ2_9BACL|nr:aspartate 1-decarboxylase [Seinonella peptonophila]SHE36039.1 L-aspartate 1-decarboxylase [Seinonella peptonophila]